MASVCRGNAETRGPCMGEAEVEVDPTVYKTMVFLRVKACRLN